MGFFGAGAGKLLPKEYSVQCQMSVLHTHELGWNDSTRGWLSKPNDKFPYGLHKLTGQHSICDPGKYRQQVKQSGVKNTKIKKAQARDVFAGKVK